MDSETAVDYIIVGQGLAGSCLALQLTLKNNKVMVFDEPQRNHASAVAAGLFNPFTGKVMAKTWMAETLFPYLNSFYTAAEKSLHQKFFYERNLYRPFLSVQEQNGWMGKSAEPSFSSYIEHIFLGPSVPFVIDPFGGLLLKHSGYVDVPVFLEAVRNDLKASGSFREEAWDDDALEISEDFIRYRDCKAKAVIFCSGVYINKSRFFSWLPINPLKGETIRVQMDTMPYIINRGVYVVPGRVPGEHTVGATYDFTNQAEGITAAGKNELETRLTELLSLPYKVTEQNWGIRPTCLDQKVIIGPHPRWRNLLSFNGLGTKGVSLAPYFALQLAEWLIGEHEILREVNIKRYKALYSKSE